MPLANKTTSKKKSKNVPEGSPTTNERPTGLPLAELSKSLEKRANKTSEESVPDTAEQGSSDSLVLSSPEALPRDLIQEMRLMVHEFQEQKKEHANQMLEMTAKLAASPKTDLQWRKEGNRKQYDIMKELLIHAHQVKAYNKARKSEKVDVHADELIRMMNERIKLLRIADSSTHGWATVAEYQANPIAEDEKDDLKIKRAEKTAQEKQEQKDKDKKAKQARFHPYSQWNKSNDTSHQDGYKAYGGYKNNNPY